jgi:hypothetical protein
MANVQERVRCVGCLFETKINHPDSTKLPHTVPMPWPPRSPDITLLDFFLWGYVKSNVFQTPVNGLDECNLGYFSGHAPQNMATARILSRRSLCYKVANIEVC